MDSELLRRLCVRAGMRVDCTGPESSLRCWRATHGEWTWSLDDPALPSYVADLLVGMVRERVARGDLAIGIEFVNRLARIAGAKPDTADGQRDGLFFAEPRHSIAAALEVLHD